jgi:hypothetical protein
VGDDVRQPGDEVPEAETWPNLRAFLDHGHVRWVDKVAEKPEPEKDFPEQRDPALVQHSKGSTKARVGALQRSRPAEGEGDESGAEDNAPTE